MCSNYFPVTRLGRLLTFFGVDYSQDEVERDVFPLGLAPFIRLSTDSGEGGRPALLAEQGMFGLLPSFAAELQYGRKTYNARSETVHRLPSYAPAWKAGQRCIIPAESIFEPCYESGRAVRWRLWQDGDVPMGIAGVYTRWRDAFTFSMLTVNADTHPLLKRMHAPGQEKRMVVILDRADYLPWLTCGVAEAPRYFRAWHGPLLAEAAPLERGPRTAGQAAKAPTLPDPALPVKPAAPAPPPPPPLQGDLF